MICKKDVILWFKDLESYKRIDMMCTLLNMCLPFELRFLGTCLEELGRRDSQELRGIELRVNNPQDLASDMIACQKGEPTDKKIRRKMALYLALIRACNRSCVTELFRTLDEWGDREFSKLEDLDTLQELLLVYTMAANHPVFSYEQHMKCTEIFKKVKKNILVSDEHMAQIQFPKENHSDQKEHKNTDISPLLLPPKQKSWQPLHVTSSIRQHMENSTLPIFAQDAITVIPHGTKVLPSDGAIQHQIAVDGLSNIMATNIGIPTEVAQSHYNSWPGQSNIHQCANHAPSTIEIQTHHSSSPLMSQQSSPSSSRAASPNRSLSTSIILQSVQSHQNPIYPPVKNISHRDSSVRRSSSGTTPPPIGHTFNDLSNEKIIGEKMKQMDDVINADGCSMTQLQTIIRNGFGRNTYQKFKPPQFVQHQLPPNSNCRAFSPTNVTINTALPYSMQSLSLDGIGGSQSTDMTANTNYANKGGESDSGSSISSSGEISPPDTPSIIPTNTFCTQGAVRGNDQYQLTSQKPNFGIFNKQLNLGRISGRSENMFSNSSGSSPKMYTNSSIPNLHKQPSQQYIGTDVILTPSLGSSSNCMVQSNNNAATSNNTGTITGIPVPCVNVVSTNSNLGKPVLINSSTTGACGLIGNVITSNSAIPQQHHFSTSYPYHVSASHHIGSVTRPPILHHNTGLGPPPGSFRLPSFQMQANGEMIYPTYHPGGITFLSSSVTSSTSNHNIRLSSNNAASVTTQGSSTEVLQQQPLLSTPSSNILVSSSYSSLTLGVNKPVSCYNCGSQTHIGRDCHEASMDDVTRSAIYKLDYSISSTHESPITANQSQSNISTTFNSSNNSVSEKGLEKNMQNYKQKQHIITPIDIDSVSSSKLT